MSDQPIDNSATQSVASPAVAPPPGGEAPASTPANTAADTAVPGEPSEGQPQAEPKRDRKVEKRISRLTQRAEAAQREAGYWRGIAEARAAQQQGQPEPTAGDPPPSRATSEDPAARAAAESMKATLDRVRDAGKDIEDFDEVLEALHELPALSRTTVDFLGEADHPAQLAQWLTDNPKEAARIANLDPAVAVRALEKVDAKLKPAPKKITQAPPPVPTVGGRSTAEFDAEKASMDEYAAHWKARQAKG